MQKILRYLMGTPSNELGPLVTTNGMFIIDEIHEQNGKIHRDIPGGGGMFAMLGACVVTSTIQISENVKWIVDRGHDFPSSLTSVIESWGTGVHFRDDNSRYTTRGGNFYRNEDLREFEYLTPKKQISVQDWVGTWDLTVLSQLKCIHLVCSAERCLQILDQLAAMKLNSKTFVWEPVPDLCNQEHASRIMEVLQRSETIIFSPNAAEGSRLLGDEEPSQLDQVLEYIWKFDELISPHHSCVLRCGRMGSVALSNRDNDGQTRQVFHYPAYHNASPDKVIDPTGGGNSYLGAFCLGYALTQDLHIASICGNIAAGCVIEQVGIPQFDHRTRQWNGLTLAQRINHYFQTYGISQYTALDMYKRLSPCT